ncbi:hypothetical protein [Rhodococcoides kyotonense]|uniref:Uncharacterized protein n=1 Tax=Rhodococcoides kyotonense TaxID=398843 RepID=A0A239FQK9_9NOCA|nr:hypothetical protein [Rhodococcus kyotonensis]SNS59079.1 hypothetical protein SAMN05421642_103408 [Rhodococcus kyotonensis]
MITPEIANQVLHHFNPSDGYPAGGFVTDLIALISKADPRNKARLAIGFGGHVQAVLLAQEEVDGIDRLKYIAAGDKVTR